MDWNDIRYLLAVHHRGSLARAAADLGVTKATASRRIAALEDALQTTLVERHPGGMILTEAGNRCIASAQKMLAASRELESSLDAMTDETVAGVVKLSAPPWLAERLIIPSVPGFREQFDQLDLSIHTSHELVDIAAHEADLALRNLRPTAGPLICKRVGELAGCVYASTMYLERRGAPRDRDALLDHDLLVYEGRGGMPGFEWLAEPMWRHRVTFRAGDPVGLLSAAASGMGLAAIPCILGETEPSLERIESLGVGFSPLFLVGHEKSRHSPPVRAVWRLVERVLRENDDILMGREPPSGGTRI